MRIDHVTVAGPDLGALEAAFSAAGFAVAYGGAHSNGVTHMAVAPFADGSYLELISTIEPGRADSPWWGRHIAGGGGPCAWAAEARDVAAEAARVASLGVPVRGPFRMHRRRPDGRLAEWDLAHLGEGEPGSLLPFVIADRAPRELRVPGGGESNVPERARLTGVAAVVLGVADPSASALFERVYGWAPPARGEGAGEGWREARLARFAGTPVVLAAPAGEGGWLAGRLARFGPSPCAFLFAAADVDAAAERFGLAAPAPWLGMRASWFDPGRLLGARIGVAA